MPRPTGCAGRSRPPGGSILREFRRAAAALLTFAAAALGAPAAGSAQTSAPPADIWERDTPTGDWGGLRTRLENAGVTPALQEQSEVWGNLSGGVRQGWAADGLLTASLAIDLDKAARWQGASLFVSGYQIHGVGPTGPLVGALQLVSSIEATRSAKLFDLWFEQLLLDGRLSLRFGQEGANDELMLSKYAALFLNSSFGFPPLLALDLPSGGPNYPLAAPFARVRLQPSGEVTVLGAVYTGDPAPPGTGDPQLRDRHGTAFRLNDHALSFAELWYAPAFAASLGLPGTYKVGAWLDSGRFADPLHDTAGLSLANPAGTGIPLQHAGDHGVYAVIDQMVWHKPQTEAQGVGLFLQAMGAPDDRNLSNLFIAGGVYLKGPFPGRSHDVMGLAATFAGIGAAARRFGNDVILFTGSGVPYSPGETVVEATYRVKPAPWLDLQPDLQYVVHPGAGIPSSLAPVPPLRNDLIFGLRITIGF